MNSSETANSPASPTPITPESSPLATVKVDSLAKIFNTAPDQLTDEEVGRICDAFIEERKRMLEQPVKAKGQKKVDASPEMSLDDLDIKI